MAENTPNINIVNIDKSHLSAVPQCSGDSIGIKGGCRNFMEPLLLEDYTYKNEPQTLKNLLKCLYESEKSPSYHDLVCCFIYLLMLECGFIPYEDGKTETNIKTFVSQDFEFNLPQILKYTEQLPKNWKINDIYQFLFILKPFPKSICKIIIVKSTELLIINCILENYKFNILVDTLLYCVSTKIFQNFRKLSIKFKNEMALVAKQIIMTKYGAICPCLKHFYTQYNFILSKYLNTSVKTNLENAINM